MFLFHYNPFLLSIQLFSIPFPFFVITSALIQSLAFVPLSIRLLVSYWLPAPNMPTLPNHAHPRDFNENKLIAEK